MVKEILAGMAGAACITAILYAVAKYRKSKDADELQGEKIYVDELNSGEIKSWFKDKLPGSGYKGLVFYPTKENLGKWKGIQIEEMENVLIQAVYDESQDKVAAYREISFSVLSSKLDELLKNNCGAFVVEP